MLIAVAGGLGAALRAWVDSLVPRRWGIAWGVLVVNLTGSALIGVVAGLGSAMVPSTLHQVLTVGFLGGYTTFSTAAIQTAQMIVDGERTVALAHGLGMLAGAVLAAAGGIWIGQSLVLGWMR